MVRPEAPSGVGSSDNLLTDDPDTDDLLSRKPDTEPIPGYRLIQPLGRGGFGEVWKCEAPGGLLKAIKFVQGGLHALDANAPAEEELRAIERVKAIRHPFILSMERVERIGSELVIVLELADRNLFDLFTAERQEGKPGVPREDLLGYLREAAEALDVMHSRYDLQHLDIKPQNLFVISNHVKVGDFGLVSSLSSREAGKPALALGAITPIYAAPEVFQGSLSRHSDQYSLAIVYQELLTGTLPFTGKNSRQLMLRHIQDEPDLAALPEADRPVLARALAKSPNDRFPSCSDFIHALIAGQTEVVSDTVPAVLAPAGKSAASKETRRAPSARTPTNRIPTVRPQTAKAAPGLQLLDLIARTPLTESWNAKAPDGSARLARVIFGFAGGDAITRLTALRHPALVPMEVVQQTPGNLMIVTRPIGRPVRDHLLHAQSQGMAGMPRFQVLLYLRAAARALHYLTRRYGLQHLALNPRNLLIVNSCAVQLADFGLAHLLWLPAGQCVAQINARYSAPELHARQLSNACDQYSLGLIYHELMTGCLPQPSRAGGGRGAQVLCVDRLPEADRRIIARALDPTPQRRWPSSFALIRALEAVAVVAAEESGRVGEWESAARGQEPALSPPLPLPTSPPLPVTETAPAFSAAAASRPAPAPAESDALQTRFGTSLSTDIILQRLEGFREQWKGKLVSTDTRGLVFQMQTPRSFWQLWTGRQPGLEVAIQFFSPPSNPTIHARTEVCVGVRASASLHEQSEELLRVVGPLLVESVRTHLQVNPRGRMEERLIWQHPLHVCCVHPDGSLGARVECHGKDISLNGIGFYLPGQLPTSEVRLHLPQTAQTPEMVVAARVVRVQGCGDGWYECGAVLLRDRLEERMKDEG